MTALGAIIALMPLALGINRSTDAPATCNCGDWWISGSLTPLLIVSNFIKQNSIKTNRRMKFLIFLLVSLSIFAQNDSLNKQTKDSLTSITHNIIIKDSLSMHTSFQLKPKHFIIPGVLITYGVLATETKWFKKINFDTRNEITEDHPTFRTTIDNYTQFVHGAAVFALQAFGIR
jgi:hypothetical protein